MSDEAWNELREMAGPDVFAYALTHTDGWSRQHLLLAAVQRLNESYARATVRP